MITAQVDLRSRLHPVRFQGRRKTCLAFAASTAHEYHGQHAELLCVEYLFFHSVGRAPGKDPDAGTPMQAAADALQLDGQPIEGAWPYESMQRYAPLWAPPSFSVPLHKAAMQLGAPTFDATCKALGNGLVVVLGFIITDAFLRPDSTGAVRSAQPDPERGGHAVLGIGHGVDAAGQKYILIRNSWGTSWGINGYAWVTEEYVDLHLRQSATLH